MLSEHLGSICDHMILRSLLTWYSIPVGQGPGVPLLHGRPRLGVEPPVLGALEEVDLVVTRPHEGGVHLVSSVDSVDSVDSVGISRYLDPTWSGMPAKPLLMSLGYPGSGCWPLNLQYSAPEKR